MRVLLYYEEDDPCPCRYVYVMAIRLRLLRDHLRYMEVQKISDPTCKLGRL